MSGAVQPYVNDGTTVVGDADAFATCRDYIENSSCENINDRHTVDPCGGLFEGTVAAAGPCENNDQCAGDSYCNQPAPPSCGTCAAKLADNAACTEDDSCLSSHCAWDLPAVRGAQRHVPGHRRL